MLSRLTCSKEVACEEPQRCIAQLVQKALGDHIFSRYVELKREEWLDYRVQVTPWELEQYLAVT